MGKTRLAVTLIASWLVFVGLSVQDSSGWKWNLIQIAAASAFALSFWPSLAKKNAAWLMLLLALWAGWLFNNPETAVAAFGLLIILAAGSFRYSRYMLALLSMLVVEVVFIYDNNWHMLAFYIPAATILMFLVNRIFQTQESQQIAIEHQRLTALINSMADGVIATDSKGRITLYNGAALDILNTNASVSGKPLNQFLQLSTEKGQRVDILELAKKAKAYFVSRDYRIVYAEDDYIALYLSIAPVSLSYNQLGERGYIILVRDITKEKSLEEERNEFISVVSHELRTPITIAEGNISNALLLVKKEKIKPNVQLAIQDAHDKVIFLANMMNDLATLSRAERGKLEVKPEVIDPKAVVEQLKREYTKQAQEKGIEIVIKLEGKLENISTSRLYLEEILQNLVTNAIKYTKKGEIIISAQSNLPGSATFAVRDTGIGISKADQKHLFEKFFRSEDFRTQENSGTGLGLYVTAKLAKLLGAHIRVESQLNKGSTFYVTFHSMDAPKKNIDNNSS